MGLLLQRSHFVFLVISIHMAVTLTTEVGAAEEILPKEQGEPDPAVGTIVGTDPSNNYPPFNQQKEDALEEEEEGEDDDDMMDERMSSTSCLKKCKKCGSCVSACKSKCGKSTSGGNSEGTNSAPARKPYTMYGLTLPDNCHVEPNGDFICITERSPYDPFYLQTIIMWAFVGVKKVGYSLELTSSDCSDGGNVKVEQAKGPGSFSGRTFTLMFWKRDGRCYKMVISDCTADDVSKPCNEAIHVDGGVGKKMTCYDQLPASTTRSATTTVTTMDENESTVGETEEPAEEEEEEGGSELGVARYMKKKGKLSKKGCTKKCQNCQKCLTWCHSKCPKYKDTSSSSSSSGASGASAPAPVTKPTLAYYVYPEPLCHVRDNGDIYCLSLPTWTEQYNIGAWTDLGHKIRYTHEQNSTACGGGPSETFVDKDKKTENTGGGAAGFFYIFGSNERTCHFLLIHSCFERPFDFTSTNPTTPTPCSKWFTMTGDRPYQMDCVR